MIVASGDGSGNTTPPPDDPGFANVGVTSTTFTGVYLGNRWVLTAGHVGAVPITLGGALHEPVPGSLAWLANPGGGNAPDLVVYQLATAPSLPSLALSSATPTAGETIVCIGNGWDRQAPEFDWNANWEQVPPAAPPAVYSGFEYGARKTLRWGTNRVTGSGIDWGNTESFDTEFDRVGLADEFQAVSGDSGGGCFAKRAGTWELVGVMWGRFSVPDPNDGCPPPQQPQPPNCNPPPPAQPVTTAAYTNLSIIADVAFYRSDIEAKTPAPPAVGPVLSPPAAAAAVAVLAIAGRRRVQRAARAALAA